MTYVHCTRCGTTIHTSQARVGSCPRCLAEGEYPVPELVEGSPAEGAHPDLDVVRRAFRLLELGETDRMLELFADDFSGRPLSTGETIEGPRGAGDFIARSSAGQNRLDATAFRFERNGRGQVGVFGRLRVRGPEGLVDTPAAWVYWVEGGKIKRADSYRSGAEAQRALRTAGEREAPDREGPARAGPSGP